MGYGMLLFGEHDVDWRAWNCMINIHTAERPWSVLNVERNFEL